MNGMRRSSLWLGSLSLGLLLLAAAFGHAAIERHQRSAMVQAKADLVRQLELTDLCLFTEARYTRHPSQADLHSPFQDHPLSLEHFPSGSLMPRPAARTEPHAPLD
ncbi:MAG: hypothetical protein A2010_04480 [Nitrospirae bacterium GWD2_57_9]|nr:MAG: hypothetical protein A2010_04480 [Nitrospirae bacterium GWD2_57_9]OGW48887.1 MAG: hypothetical protein A2078_02055 [Nitrospirae bacterium GWC2_57_9]